MTVSKVGARRVGNQCHNIMHGIIVLYKTFAKIAVNFKNNIEAVTFVYYQTKSHLHL